ncbi:MAG: ribosome recycling factor [Bacteroidetes bacterium]|nr:ribosome recycling factor [Bacteroidota bacterium]MBK8144307.1 ribosome recycling factor [Bacteroidota bacterium]MBP6314232.1 ribosome recycling factor [Chitinophagaceae bacterium]
MTEEIEKILKQTDDQMKKAIAHLEIEILKVRAGKASPQMLDGIMVEYYGAPTPISQVANVSIVDARTITIQPWEKNMLAPIDRAILAANIGLTPQNDGVMIKLYLPPLTEERRREFVKKVMSEGEHAKVAIRNIRRDHMEAIKKLQKDGMSEDLAKDAEGKIQAMTDKKIVETDYHCSIKEKELMTV